MIKPLQAINRRYDASNGSLCSCSAPSLLTCLVTSLPEKMPRVNESAESSTALDEELAERAGTAVRTERMAHREARARFSMIRNWFGIEILDFRLFTLDFGLLLSIAQNPPILKIGL